LFYGPPGTGKTSAILAASKQLFGDLFRTRVLELNASDDRGISVVREKVKKFAQMSVSRSADCPSFKIIILDEADSLTGDAQAALRRIIEKYTKITRFCLICNYISKIIDPLASRCIKFRFKPISDETHLARLQLIADAEGVQASAEAYQRLMDLAEGDLRRSINTLQSTVLLFGKQVHADMVREVAALPPLEVVYSLYSAAQSSDFNVLQAVVEATCLDGFQPDVLLSQFFDLILNKAEVSDSRKARIAEILAESDAALIQGGDDRLTLLKAFSQAQLVLNCS
jgi:replication factor C subunit 2/4